MSEAITIFEAELKNKLSFKSSSKVSPDAVLFKAFKFFDLFNHGHLNRKDFFKAIVKCGVVVETYNLDALYDHYDVDKSGNINYKTFIQNLFANEFIQSSMNQSSLSFKKSSPKSSKYQSERQINQYKDSQYSHPPLSYEEILENLQNKLRLNGISGLIHFANSLKAQDSHKTHLITAAKLKNYLPFLYQEDVETLVKNFQPNKFQQINYAELIYSIKGSMTQRRQVMIDNLYDTFDPKRQGEFSIRKLLQGFKNKQEFNKFRQAVQGYQTFQSIDDGIFTDQDFNDFFQFISFTFRDDASFEEFIRLGFYEEELARSVSSRSSRQRQFGSRKQPTKHYESESNYGDFRKVKKQESPISNIHESPKQKLKFNDHDDNKSVSSKRSSSKSVDISTVKDVEMMLLRMKKRLGSKGSKGFLLFEKILKHYDNDEDGLITLDQFKAAVKDQKIDITGTEALTIFNLFRTTQNVSGLVDYQAIVQTLKGEQSVQRKQLISSLWERVKLDPQHTSFSKIKSCLNFRSHPDIQTGRKYQDQIFDEIKETIMIIQDLNGTARSDIVTQDVFFEYCQNLSLSVPENQLFESIVHNFWKVQLSSKIDQQYAGSRKLFDPSYKGYLLDHHRYAIKGGSVTDNAPFGTSHGPTNYTTEHQRL